MKKVGETTRPFRYDLNQIPYDYIVEVTNRFKGLDLIDRVHEDLLKEVCDTVHEAGVKTIPKKKKCKKIKWVSEEILQRAEKRRQIKGKGEKQKYTHLNAEFQRIARRDKKAFLMLCYAKSLQLCPTLCDPIDGSPPGFPVPGILQARTLEWVAISFSNA